MRLGAAGLGEGGRRKVKAKERLMAVIENISKNGFLLVCVSALLLCTGAAVAVPSKIEQAEVRPLVNELMRPYVQNLKAGKMTPVEVGDRAMEFVAEAKTEAAKFVLLKGAVYYYTLARRYDKSAGAIVAIMKLAPDIPANELYEITSKAAANATGGTASRLIALNNEVRKRLAVAKRLVEVEKSLKKTPDDTDLLRLHAEVVAATGDWESALKEFVKLGGETGRMAGGDSNAGYSNSQMADFWWNYAPMEIEAKDIIRRHAAALYRKAIKNNELEGLKKTIAERRIQEAGLLNRQNFVPEPRVRAASSNSSHDYSPKPVVEKRIEEVLGMPNDGDKGVEPSPVVARKTGDVKTITLPGGETMEMIYVAPGSFMMGSPESEEGRRSDEKQHRVTLTKGFWLGKYEVTQKQWKSVMGNNPSQFKGDDLPVERVYWGDCQKFIRKVNAQLNCGARLPTEAEWEYACRAGTTGPYAGDGLDGMGWYKSNGRGRTHPVGQKQPNPWGFYDMHGNVWELCDDWYGYYPYGSVMDPTGSASGDEHVLRGGSWFHKARVCRSARRGGRNPGKRTWDDGFRLCCSEE